MPYIKGQDKRKEIEKLAKQLLEKTGYATGNLNCFIYIFCKLYMKDSGESYAAYKNVIGELEMAKLEIYRRLCSKYENKAIKRNGDIEIEK